MANEALDRWREPAMALESADINFTVPWHVLMGEAVDVARFHADYWAAVRDADGKVTRRGLELAVCQRTEQPGLGPANGTEILSLQEAAQQAQTAYLTLGHPDKPSVERAGLLLKELAAGLEWLFDDGVDDEWDERLAKLDEKHAEDPASNDALASALDDYAGLAKLVEADLEELPEFNVAWIAEAVELAKSLRERPTGGRTLTPEQQTAIDLRNRVCLLLTRRMNVVRAAARYVFRHDPEILRRATSAYERRRRALARARKTQTEGEAAEAAAAAETTE